MAFVTVPLGGGLGHCVEHLKSAGTQKRDLQVKSLNSLDITGRCARSNSQRNSKLIKNSYELYKRQRNICTSLRRKAIKTFFDKKSESENQREFWDTYQGKVRKLMT